MYSSLRTGLIDGNKLYTVDIELGLLLEYDLDNLDYRVVAKLDNKAIKDDFCRVNNIVKVDEVLYMAFEKRDHILSYDLNTGKMQLYEQKAQLHEVSGTEKIIYINGTLWIFPRSITRKIKTFNLFTKKFVELDSLNTYVQNAGYSIQEECNVQFSRNVEDKIYFAMRETPYMLIFDICTKDVLIHKIYKDQKIFKVIFDGEYNWASFVNNAKCVKWDEREDRIEEWEIKEIELDDRERPISFLCERNGYTYIVPTYVETILTYQDGKLLSKYEKRFKRSQNNLKRASFSTMLFYNQYALLLPYNANKIIKIDLSNGEITSIDSVIKKEDWDRYILNEKYVQKGNPENEYFGLKEFVQYQCQEL